MEITYPPCNSLGTRAPRPRYRYHDCGDDTPSCRSGRQTRLTIPCSLPAVETVFHTVSQTQETKPSIPSIPSSLPLLLISVATKWQPFLFISLPPSGKENTRAAARKNPPRSGKEKNTQRPPRQGKTPTLEYFL